MSARGAFAKSSLYVLLPGLLVSLGGCGFEHYRARPLQPQVTAARLAARSLRAPVLRAYLEHALGHRLRHWPLLVWTPRRLTLAALYYNPQLAAARARMAIAQAGLSTAAERPNPSLGIGPGYETFPVSPWTLRLGGLLPIETAGKRAARMRVARRQIEMVRFQIASAAWHVRAQLRAALLAFFNARRRLALLRAAARNSAQAAQILRRRYQAGEWARPPYLAAERRSIQAQMALEQAQGAFRQARLTLAAAIGVPASSLRGGRLQWPGFGQPPAPASLPKPQLERWAEINRLDLRQALAQYAVAQANLQSQIALQYPNLNLGPGYSYEEAQSVLRLTLSLVLPVFNHNQGPIAQAKAERDQLAAAFMALQARDRAAAANAWEGYRAAWNAWHTALANERLAGRVQAAAGQAMRQGETGKLSYNAARTQSNLARQNTWRALANAQAALGQLEDAVERPLTPAWQLSGKKGKP